MADRTLAGKVHAVIGSQRFEIIGELTLDATNESREGMATSGGKAYVTVKAKPYRAKCKFANFIQGNPDVFWNLTAPFDMTFVESTRNIRHLFTGASAVGDPSTNLTTGEVDGIEIISDSYKKTQQ